jgi:hypothetical protein
MNLEKLNPEEEEVMTREELLSIQGGDSAPTRMTTEPQTPGGQSDSTHDM